MTLKEHNAKLRAFLEIAAAETCTANPWNDGARRECPDPGWIGTDDPDMWCIACQAKKLLKELEP